MLEYLKHEAQRQPVVFPVHPRTREAMSRYRLNTEPLCVCRPLSYLEMNRLLSLCSTVYTDSGGLQKEAYFHGKPCVTLRDETEWVETVECGWNRLWHESGYRPRRPITDYGDGHAAERVVALLVQRPR